jgi:hypothetical protein
VAQTSQTRRIAREVCCRDSDTRWIGSLSVISRRHDEHCICYEYQCRQAREHAIRNAMSRIVSYAHRYKRPPRKKPKAAALAGPAIITTKKNRRSRRRRAAAEVVAPSRSRGSAAQHTARCGT